MNLYQRYSLPHLILRRTATMLVAILALPVMLFYRDRSRFYSYLHRCWCKNSTQPVWLAQSEMAATELY
ncbi:YbfA family protein [Erwinia sp. BNK-24-b]|uniref:YbfA family protein n=1 Tax=Erwinia TaxID=551 RepID=UPI001FEF856C|nr:YbfA family protein [Erwinia phyllosphaerae]MBV4368670.1 YbfA family protein [Erwinia phyllosphaerae]